MRRSPQTKNNSQPLEEIDEDGEKKYPDASNQEVELEYTSLNDGTKDKIILDGKAKDPKIMALAQKIEETKALHLQLVNAYADMVDEVAVTHTKEDLAVAKVESREAENAVTDRRGKQKTHMALLIFGGIGTFVFIAAPGTAVGKIVTAGLVAFYSLFALYFFKFPCLSDTDKLVTRRSNKCCCIECFKCCDIDTRRACWGAMLIVVLIVGLILDRIVFLRLEISKNLGPTLDGLLLYIALMTITLLIIVQSVCVSRAGNRDIAVLEAKDKEKRCKLDQLKSELESGVDSEVKLTLLEPYEEEYLDEQPVVRSI